MVCDAVRQSGDSLAKIILESMVDGSKSRCRPEKSWVTDIANWIVKKVAELITTARGREA